MHGRGAQVNKNVLVKGRVGTDHVAAAFAWKAWWQPSFVVAASVEVPFKVCKPRFGVSFGVENFGNIRSGAGSPSRGFSVWVLGPSLED
jgi:hypothetical protein